MAPEAGRIPLIRDTRAFRYSVYAEFRDTAKRAPTQIGRGLDAGRRAWCGAGMDELTRPPHQERDADALPPALIPARYTLFLEDYRVEARIGVHAAEKRGRQPLSISVELEVAARSEADSIEAVVNYEAIVAHIEALIADRHYNLQESFCRDLIARCRAMANVFAVCVTTRKTAVYPNARAVGCTMRWPAG